MARKKDMHIYPFRVDFTEGYLNQEEQTVSQLMEDAIYKLSQREKKDRIWTIDSTAGDYSALAEIKKAPDGTYLLGFSKFSMTGPAKANINSGEITAFEMNEDEVFAHQTAALYDPATNAFIAESSKTSLSPDRMLSCITQVMPEDYLVNISIYPIIQEDVVIQVLKGGLIRKLELTICPAYLQPSAFKKGLSINSFLQSRGQKSFGGELTLTWKDNKSIPEEGKKIIRWACDLFTKCTGGFLYPIKRCKVIQEKPDNQRGTIPLDLLEARVSDKVPVEVGQERMVAFVKKYTALKDSYKKWKNKYFII